MEELEADASTAEPLAAANELRTAILSAVSHDLRTPLAGIKASVTSLLARRRASGPSRATGVPRRRSTRTPTGSTRSSRNLLDMSRLQTGSLEVDTLPVGLEEVVPARAAQHRLDGRRGADRRRRRPARACSPTPGSSSAPFANVVANAIRHGAGSPVRVTAGRAGDDDRPARQRRGRRASPPADRESVFRPFQRLGDAPDGEGVGLGLAVARGFVEAMGGSIELEDTPGGGLTVVLRLEEAVP